MVSPHLRQTIEALCQGIPQGVLQDFFVRMDDDYFTTFSPEEVAAHIRMASRLDAKRRIQVRITPHGTGGGEFDIVIAGFDYLSEFSVFCGLLSAFGLDIESGDTFSFSKDGHSSPRKIVDAFYVRSKPGETFDDIRQREFETELQSLAEQLASGAFQEARESVNRFLTERIERMNEELTGLLSLIDIRFDNDLSADWTVMEARSEDTFAFLYAISNALAMRDVYIHKVKIRSAGRQARDEFFIADRWGRKIEDSREQEMLRMAVAMIKQFTGHLPEAPDPAKAMRHFDQFLDKMAEDENPAHVINFLAEKQGMNLLAHLLGSSDFLWDEFLSIHFKELLPILENLGSAGAGFSRPQRAKAQRLRFEEEKRLLNRYKDTQVFLIDVRHLLDRGMTLTEFSRQLTDLAECVISEAAAICSERAGAAPGAFAICGLGKFGGREMGYASDLELLFVYDAPGQSAFFESLAREIVESIEAPRNGIFHIDLRLRPYGDAGAWAASFDEFKRYYSSEGQAAPFERQALIKLRWVAGDEALGRRIEAHRDAFTYSGVPWDRRNALQLRLRQMRELVKPGHVNVKYSAGGIIDIEYAIQYLQLLHGKEYPELRAPSTTDALDQLRRLQIVSEAEYDALHTAYLFLRNLIDALRIVRGDASDLLLPPESSDEFKSLARRLGYRERDRGQAAASLARDIGARMKTAHQVFEQRFLT